MAGPIAWQLATVTAIRDETPTVRSFTLGVPAWTRTSSRPARRPAADRRGRLQRRAELLDRVRAGAGRRDRDHRRAHRRWRGLALPPRRRRRRRPDRGARPDRRLLRLGGSARRAAVPGRRRVRRRAADGDAAPSVTRRIAGPDASAVQLAPPRGDHLSRGARPPRGERRRPRGLPHADAVAATGLVGLRPTHRRAHAGGGARAARVSPHAPTCADRHRSSRRRRTRSSVSACRPIVSGPNASAPAAHSRRRISR